MVTRYFHEPLVLLDTPFPGLSYCSAFFPVVHSMNFTILVDQYNFLARADPLVILVHTFSELLNRNGCWFVCFSLHEVYFSAPFESTDHED